MRLLVNLFLFFAVMPFISPRPTQSDVQLPAFLLAAAIMGHDLVKGRVRIDWVDLVFLSMGAWSFCFVLPGGEFVLRQRVGLLMAFLIYYVAKRHAGLFSPTAIFTAIVLNMAATLLQWVRPDLFALMLVRLVRTLKAVEGTRGLGGLSAEPSFLAAMAVVQGLLLFYYFKRGETTARRLIAGWAMAFSTLLLSRSATGFTYLLVACAIYFSYYVFRGLKPSVWVAFSAFGLIALWVMTGPLATSRGGAIIVALYEHPEDVIADGAMQERVSSLAVGVLSVPHHVFGVGGGRYEAVAHELDAIYDFSELFPQANPDVFGGVLSSVGLYLVENGVIFIAFLAVVFWKSSRLEAFHMLFTALAFLFILVTFSIAFPLTWLLLGLAARRDFLGRRPAPLVRRLAA
jgi:hypothetical protein